MTCHDVTGVSPSWHFGLLLTAVTVMADQTLKWYLLGPFALLERKIVMVTSFFDLVLVGNRGISYGLLQQGSVGRWVLVGISIILILVLFIFLFRANNFISTMGFALIIGGAIGNMIDRISYGVVVDFISLHVANFYWYVFNLADCAIVIGVTLLLYNLLFNYPDEHNKVRSGET